ncbi:MAG: hypothetical protein N2316_00655 [Spirochaetes bacterium]|nr:hypothetical protein [Spirochaetota bacterium]
MSNYVSVIFCRNCGSRYVEAFPEQNASIVFFCRACGVREITNKFTLGRCKVGNTELQNAFDTRAGKVKPERVK